MRERETRETGVTFWCVLRRIALTLLAIQIYLGIGAGLTTAVNAGYNQRCGATETVDDRIFVATTALWPTVVIAAVVARVMGVTAKPCPVR